MDIVFDFLQENKNKLKPVGFGILVFVGLYGISLIKSEEDPQQNQEKNNKPAGIMNEGNTCFVNSLLQALASVQTFQKHLQKLLKINSIADQNQELMLELSKVFKKINRSSNENNISVMSLLNILSKTQNQLINFEQQDTYQLYSCLIRSFDEFFNKRKQLNLSISSTFLNADQDEDLQNPLIGYTKSTIQCLTCNNTTTIKIHSFYQLSLEIISNYIVNLQSALLWFERKENIQNYACTQCSIKAHIDKLQRIKPRIIGNWSQQLCKVIEKLIEYLSKNTFEDMDLKQINMALQRQVQQFRQIFQKMGNNIFRNQIFSLIKPVERQIIKQTKITKYPKILVIHFKQLVISPTTGQLIYMRKYIDFPSTYSIPLKTSRKNYKLTSLLTHQGNENMGHYFTFRKKSRFEDDWYLISDTQTSICSQKTMRKHLAYMLFYELHDEQFKDQLSRSMRISEVRSQQQFFCQSVQKPSEQHLQINQQ